VQAKTVETSVLGVLETKSDASIVGEAVEGALGGAVAVGTAEVLGCEGVGALDAPLVGPLLDAGAE
jgi:hypothetical protein